MVSVELRKNCHHNRNIPNRITLLIALIGPFSVGFR